MKAVKSKKLNDQFQNFIQSSLKLIVLVSVLVSCSTEKSNNTRQANIVRSAQGQMGSNLDQNSGQFISASCAQNTSQIGTIYLQNAGQLNGQNQFEYEVKKLLSATINPNEIGSISSNPSDPTGVRFQGSLRLQSNGQVDLAQTQMQIKVYDSYAYESAVYGTNNYSAIPIEFKQASSGEFNLQTGLGYVVFSDAYGDIRFEGKIQNDYFLGTVSYVNKTNIMGGSGATGQLGQFYIARCAIIK